MHRQSRENLSILRHITYAGMGNLIGSLPRNGLALERDLALRRHQPHDRLAGGRAAHAVAAKQADDLALIDMQIDTLQDMTLTIVGVQIADFEHHVTSLPR